MEREIKLITAEEARKTADTTNLLMKRIMKEIDVLSKEGLVQLNWCINNSSDTLIDTVKHKLETLGYSVELEFYDNVGEHPNYNVGEFRIKW